MELDELPRLIQHARDGLTSSLQPIIDVTKPLPKTSEVKSLRRKLLRSYTSLSDAIGIMPDVVRSLESYQPNLSFNAEAGEPNAAHLASVQRALAERRQRNSNRAQMGVENTRSKRLRERERNRRLGNIRAAFARGEEVIHMDGGRKHRKTKKQRRR